MCLSVLREVNSVSIQYIGYAFNFDWCLFLLDPGKLHVEVLFNILSSQLLLQ